MHFTGFEIELLIRAVGVMQGVKAKQGDYETVSGLEHIETRLRKLHKKLTGGKQRV